MKPFIFNMKGTVGGVPVEQLPGWVGGKYAPYIGREGIYLRRYKTFYGPEILWARWGYKERNYISVKAGAINWAFEYDGGRYWFLPGNNIDEALSQTIVDRQQHLAWRGTRIIDRRNLVR